MGLTAHSLSVLSSPDDPWRPPHVLHQLRFDPREEDRSGLSQSLTQEERSAVAQRAVDELRRHGDPWKLDEELPKAGEVHSTPREVLVRRVEEIRNGGRSPAVLLLI